MKSPRSHSVILTVVAVVLCTVVSPAAEAQPPAHDLGLAGSLGAGQGLSIDNALIDLTVVPGQTVVHTLTLAIGDDMPALHVSIAARGFGQTPDGAMVPLPADADHSPFSARECVQRIEPQRFELRPGENAQVRVTFAIPHNLSPDPKYAALHIETRPTDPRNSGIRVDVEVPIVLTPSGCERRPAGHILDLRARAAAGRLAEVTATVRNTGNHHYRLEGRVTIIAPDGQRQAVAFPAASSSLLPTFLRELTLDAEALGQIAIDQPGTYVVRAEVTTGDGDVLDAAETTLEVTSAPPWDVNGDRICNIGDICIIGSHWQERVSPPGSAPWDINGDGFVNILDVVVIGDHWLEAY